MEWSQRVQRALVHCGLSADAPIDLITRQVAAVDLLKAPDFGRQSLTEVRKAAQAQGLRLRNHFPRIESLKFLRLSAKEHLILELLTARGSLYGLEMVKASNGELKRGTVYVTIGRMYKRGLIKPKAKIDRSKGDKLSVAFTLTDRGTRVMRAWQRAEAVLDEK